MTNNSSKTSGISMILIDSRVIPWAALALQFGSDYARLRDFKAALITELKKVLVVYTRVQVEALEDGLLLEPSLTHIGKRDQ